MHPDEPPQCATFGKHLAIRPGPARRRWSWGWQRIGYLTCVRCGMRWGPMPAVLMGEPYTLAPCQTCGQLVYHGPTTPVPEHVIWDRNVYLHAPRWKP